MDIWDEIKISFHKGSNLVKLIYVNLAVFLLIILVRVFVFLLNINENDFSLVYWLAVPSSLSKLIFRPWTIFTYMFLHEKFWHILFNMLWLFWFGRIFLIFLSQKQLVNVYLLGGLMGAAFYILAYNIFPAFSDALNESSAIGASASVMAVVFGAVTISPNYTIQLLFLGPVKIKWIAGVFIIMDLMQIPLGNAGGHIAHLGGAFLGFYYVSQYQKGKEIAQWFSRWMDSLFSFLTKKKKLKVTHKKPVTDLEYNSQKAQKQARVDQILDKISKSGYDSLNQEEKDILFNMSNKE